MALPAMVDMTRKQLETLVLPLKGIPADVEVRWRKLGPRWKHWKRNTKAAKTRRERLYFVGLILAVSAVVVLDFWLVSCGFKGCPSRQAILMYKPSEGGRILDRSGAVLGQMESVKRVNVSLEMVPQHVRDAFIATEDRRFYEHDGLDWRGVARATLKNIREMSFREGFSTITMQLARTSFIDGGRARNPLGRKLLEMRLSRILEHSLTKEQILEHYLNAIYLGAGIYGVEGASRDLFGKSVRNVSVAEGALLAALPKAPTVYNPRSNHERATARRDLVLVLMRREGMLDSVSVARAQRSEIRLAASTWTTGRNEPSALTPVRVFVDSILESLKRAGEEVWVHTSLDAAAQRAADNAVTRRAAAIQRESNAWYGENKGEIQGAMVALDPQTGEIVALVGAGKYERGGFNRALYAKRQPGSAFKPFVYATALQRGFTPASMVDDSPVSVMDVGAGKMWNPANYGGAYSGQVTLRSALARSANAATVRVSREVGEKNIVRLAEMNGIRSPLLPVPSIALGALEVTPVELVSAYAPFANGGFRIEPTFVMRIESRAGEVLYSSSGHERMHVMDERDAFLVTSLLRSVVDEGTGSAIRAYGVGGPVAGKTGTTNDATDVWFIGYTPTLVAGFWFGYDTPRAISSNATGGRLAGPAWAEFYRNGWRRRENGGWKVPAGIVRRLVDIETGELATEWCPLVRDEYFRSGTEPTEYCTGHDYSFGRWIGNFGSDIVDKVGGWFRRGRRDTGDRRGVDTLSADRADTNGVRRDRR